jgi:hypothetical protein
MRWLGILSLVTFMGCVLSLNSSMLQAQNASSPLGMFEGHGDGSAFLRLPFLPALPVARHS